MKELMLKGDNADQKLNHVEKILQRFSRRLHKIVAGVIPPSIVYGYVDEPNEAGVILKCIVPADGSISKACLAVDEYTGKGQVKFTVAISNGGESNSKSFMTRKPIEIVNVDIPVIAGDCLELTTEIPPAVKGVYATILYNIGLKDSQIQTVMIDELERVTGMVVDEGI